MCLSLAVVQPELVVHLTRSQEVNLRTLDCHSETRSNINVFDSAGLKTALIEADDFASGTSSRSTKLIHGGVRYLQKAILGVSGCCTHCI